MRGFAITVSLLCMGPLQAETCGSILGNLFVKDTRTFTLFTRTEEGLSRAGRGQLMQASAKSLEFRYRVLTGSVRPEGTVKLEYLYGCRYRLTVTGAPGRGSVTEEVEADPLFIRGGMLHFYFDRRRRFFQIDRRGNETRMVTEYGSVVFRPQ